MTDDWLRLDRARAGDKAAWEILFEQYYPALVRMAFVITGSYPSGQDIAQEAFVDLLRAKIRHRDGSVKSFLSTIAYRKALKERQTLLARGNLDGDAVTDESPSILEGVVKNETDRLILCAVRALAIEQREVLTLRYFGEQSYEEIAQALKIPLGTVKSRIFYEIKSCRDKLSKQGVFK